MADQDKPKLNINVNPNTTPILYTDMVFMNVNEDGISFDVCQKLGSTNQIQVVARIGMSRSHAKKFVKKLSEILALTEGHSQTGEKPAKN
jgi:hypothetical protein